jgi:hypothetical protein
MFISLRHFFARRKLRLRNVFSFCEGTMAYVESEPDKMPNIPKCYKELTWTRLVQTLFFTLMLYNTFHIVLTNTYIDT